MQYKLFGKSGLRVSELALGTMTFGEEWGWGSNKSDSKKVFDVFAKEGGNFIDTADVYTQGVSEEIVGRWISQGHGSWRCWDGLRMPGGGPLSRTSPAFPHPLRIPEEGL